MNFCKKSLCICYLETQSTGCAQTYPLRLWTSKFMHIKQIDSSGLSWFSRRIWDANNSNSAAADFEWLQSPMERADQIG